MKVQDIMQKDVTAITPKTSVMDAARLIFQYKHTGLPVVSGSQKKLVGFITDQDILSECFPSMQEYVEDVVRARDFDTMEKKVKEISRKKVEDVMSHKIISIKAADALMKAESLMKVKDVARLPVVDDNGNLIGILTKRDIFRTLLGKIV